MKHPLVSVIIPTFRALDCLKISLAEFLTEERCEVVVGLDGDRPDFRRALERHPVTLSVTERRQGACATTNLAAAQARGDYLLFCNDDMVPGPAWLDAMLRPAGPKTVVSAVCWEPGLIPAPPPHAVRDFGHHPGSFRRDDFFAAARRETAAVTEPGVNYPFMISRTLWDRVGGLDERFEPGSASDPDLFIRLALLDPAPEMVRARGAVFYHFASRSSIFAGGRVSLGWKLHRRHGRLMFRMKWGRMWEHRFGQAPAAEGWRGIKPGPEPPIAGGLWRRIWFGPRARHQVVRFGSGPGEAGGVREPEPWTGRTITIYVWGGLGNAVMALPMINAARAALGDRNVSLVLPGPEMARLVPEPGRLKNVKTAKDDGLLGVLQAAKADIALASLPYPRWRYGLLSVLGGARLRIGDAELRNPLLNRPVATGNRGSHLVERNLAMLEAIGLRRGEAAFDIPVNQRAREAVVCFLENAGIGGKTAITGLHPGSGNPVRRWPEERFVELGRALVGQGRRIVVFGGPGEEGLAARAASGIGTRAVPFCADLETALAMIERCAAFIAADSGLAHCAAALGVPTLALMGPSDERMYRPYGPRVRVLTGKADCRPCYRPGRPVRCRHQRRICLDIGVEEALEGLGELA